MLFIDRNEPIASRITQILTIINKKGKLNSWCSMAKWGYLRRAYAIKEYAYMRQTEAENTLDRTEEDADKLSAVIDDIKMILEMAEDCDDYRTAKQCRAFLNEFNERSNK